MKDGLAPSEKNYWDNPGFFVQLGHKVTFD